MVSQVFSEKYVQVNRSSISVEKVFINGFKKKIMKYLALKSAYTSLLECMFNIGGRVRSLLVPLTHAF